MQNIKQTSKNDVLRYAAEYHSSFEATCLWYQRNKLKGLGELSAEQLVDQGKGELVIEYLKSIKNYSKKKIV